MTTFLQTFSRAAVVAVALAGTTMVATAPAQAGYSYSYHVKKQKHHDYCLSDPQVRQLLRHHGYRQIKFFDRKGRVVQVTARKGKTHFVVAVDSCRGSIVGKKKLRW